MARGNDSRPFALEQDYVHEVYGRIGGDLARVRNPLERAVGRFLRDLEIGSVVADIGCGDGKHMRSSKGLFPIGIDVNVIQTELFHEEGGEAIAATNLSVPMINDQVDAVLSIGVLQHFCTEERRINALKEMTRILKVGGRILIAVLKSDKQHCKDVLIPWYDVTDKNNKDGPLIEQDSGEYDLSGDSDDTLSVSSSDGEEAATASTNTKPSDEASYTNLPGYRTRQSRSLDYDAGSSSFSQNSELQETQPLGQINKYYNYFRKAFRRFSSASSGRNDYGPLERSQTADSAISFSSSIQYDRRISNLSDSLLSSVKNPAHPVRNDSLKVNIKIYIGKQ